MRSGFFRGDSLDCFAALAMSVLRERWLALTTVSPQEPDAAHPVRYVHRHDVRYVSEDMSLVLQIQLGLNFALVVFAGCHFASRDVGDGYWPGRIGEP
ncbi:hypothetical protein SAMN05216525_14944 [Bradyrhizobium sp. Gha]|nr:hypothetical protein SAMN05216525_14944 [Bradyrhizobium sp. Gha]